MNSARMLSGPFDPFRSPLTNEDQLEALARSLLLAESYTVLLAVCNRPGLRERLIAELAGRLAGKRIEEVRADAPLDNLYRALEERYPDGSVLPDVLIVWGFELWMPADGSRGATEFVANLNVTRDHFPRLLRGPMVLWLPQHGLDLIVSRAPDFVSARSGVFFFAADEAEGRSFEAVREILGLAGVAGLTLEDKRARAAELDRLLAELESVPEASRDRPQERRVLQAAAETAYVLGDFAKAERLSRLLLERDEQAFGPDHPKVATDLNNLAQLLKATNHLAEAEPLMCRSLAIWEQSFGENHPNVAAALNNLAALLQDTNRLAEAEPLMRRALAIDERSYGPDHPTVAIRLSNLARLLWATNRLAEAEQLMRRAMAIDEQSYGPDHPNMAIRLNNLAQLLQATNRLVEAEPLMRRALAIWEQSLGENHPNVAAALNNLAGLLLETNRLAEVEPLMRQALEVFENSLGEDHPNVATALNNLARLLQDTNRLAEAEPLMRRALAIDERSYGPDHPDVAKDLNNLAMLLQATNRQAEAEPLMRRALEIFLKFTVATGHEHPHLRAAFRSYGDLLKRMGRGLDEVRARLDEVARPFDVRPPHDV